MSVRRGCSIRSIHAGEAPDPSTGAHGVLIYQNATFGFCAFESVEAWREGAPHFLYARDGNPTMRCLELKLANLEGTEDAVATGTGMAAIGGALLNLQAGGGHLVASANVYAMTKEFPQRNWPSLGATVTPATSPCSGKPATPFTGCCAPIAGTPGCRVGWP